MSGHHVRENLTYQNVSLLSARNTVKDAKKPVFKPTVWQVDAKDRFSWDKSVKAQPSTAMSIAKDIKQLVAKGRGTNLALRRRRQGR